MNKYVGLPIIEHTEQTGNFMHQNMNQFRLAQVIQ